MITFHLRRYDSLGSTNDEARRLAETGALHGTVVTADRQTAGRGRQGRHWASPIGNLYLSVLLRLAQPPARFPELGFLAAVAAAEATDRFAPGRATLKWPNDVLVDGAKLSGILLERTDPALIIGIGLNVLHVPPGTPGPATSLTQLGAANVSVPSVRAALLDALARRLAQWTDSGFEPIRIAWLARAHPPGTRLVVTTATGSIRGEFAGLAANGALLLDTDCGQRELIAGDVAMA
jgi:BirA family biotin operon repressor/biotin-[acetyl-CoA-carboxylase] ligase